MANDIEKLGIEFKVLAATEPAAWNKLSFWSRANDVHFSDFTQGTEETNTVQNRLGGIYGITSSSSTLKKDLAVSSYIFGYLCGENAIITLAAAGWSSTKTTSGGNSYYTYEVGVTEILLDHPIMYLNYESSSNPVPADTTLDIWNELHMVADVTNKKLTFYSEDKPTVDLSIGLKGVIK